MIIGWFFMISNQVINSDSNYKFMKSMIRGLIRAGKARGGNDLFIVFLPKTKTVRYQRDGFFDEFPARVLPVVTPMPSQKTLQATYFDSQFVYDMTREYGINVYLNNIPEIGAQLSSISPNFSETEPLLVTYNHYTIHPTLPYPMHAYTHLRLLELLGNYLSDIVMFNTQYHFSMLEDNAREFQLQHWLAEIKKKLHIVPIPVLDGELAQFYEETAPFSYDPHNILFYYNHRLQNYKHWETTFDVLKSLWDGGLRNFKVWLSYASGDYVLDAQARYPFIQVRRTHTHAEYYAKLTVPHFNTTNTTHETFCISIVESALLGGIPIVPRRVTFPELFPKSYPFFFSTVEEQKEIIRNVLTQGYSEEYLTEVKIALRKHFSKFNSKDVGELAYNIISDAFKTRAKFELERMKHPEKAHSFMASHRGRSYEFRELYRIAKREIGLGNQAMPAWRFSMLLENFPHEKWVEKGKVWVSLDT